MQWCLLLVLHHHEKASKAQLNAHSPATLDRAIALTLASKEQAAKWNTPVPIAFLILTWFAWDLSFTPGAAVPRHEARGQQGQGCQRCWCGGLEYSLKGQGVGFVEWERSAL